MPGRTHWISERLNEYLFINIYNSLLYCWENKYLGMLEGSECLSSSQVPIMTMAVHESTLSNVVLYSVSTLDPWTFCHLISPCHWVTHGAPRWDSQTCACLQGHCWAWITLSQQKATSQIFAQHIPSCPLIFPPGLGEDFLLFPFSFPTEMKKQFPSTFQKQTKDSKTVTRGTVAG